MPCAGPIRRAKTAPMTARSSQPPSSSRGPATRHIEPLTGLRGFAALFVVVYHLSGGFLPNLSVGDTMLLAKGYLAVDLFFLLSGFVMMHVYGGTFGERLRRSDLSSFALARFARLYPLHATILFGFVLLEALKLVLLALDPGLPDVEAFVGGRTLGPFFLHATMTHGLGLFPGPSWNGPAWSIGAEWIAYLVFPAFVLMLGQMEGAGGRPFFAALFLALGAVLALIGSGGVGLDVTYVGGLWRCLVEFSLGVMLYRIHASGRMRRLGGDLPALALLAALALALHLGIADILVVPLLALLILALAEDRGRVAGVFRGRAALFLGTVSYSLYMVHILMIELANLASRALTHEPLGVHLGEGASFAVLFLGPLGAILAATALHRFVELPGRDAVKAFRLAQRRAAAESA